MHIVDTAVDQSSSENGYASDTSVSDVVTVTTSDPALIFRVIGIMVFNLLCICRC